MTISQRHGAAIDHELLRALGLSIDILLEALQYTHQVLDQVDYTLCSSGGERLASLLELANVSAIVGNLFRRGISIASNGAFQANKPHTYPDLLAVAPGTRDIEIKVALETNKPKGHLIKPGPHVTVRYVLADDMGQYKRGKEARGNVVWIWEIRVGILEEDHFNFSNTAGDSGKTAVINALGMAALSPVFVDMKKCPHSPKGRNSLALVTLLRSQAAYSGHLRPQP